MDLPLAKELDFTEIWTNSIDKEVLRGIKVRNEKFKVQQSNSIYHFVDIDFAKPSCSKSYGSQINRSLESRKNENFHRSISPQRIKRYKKLKKNKRNGRNRCGMRVAELAVPSKRHCIDTWRSRWDTLPTLMVYRLRRIVMDQKPIVPIHDAINCFKQKQPKNSRSPYKENKTLKSKKNKNIEMLCAIFGFRISAQLQAPRNITLASSLIPISQIVSHEISCLLPKRKTSNFKSKIHLEITNKITNWIADVLEQSNYNLTLEDYIELEKEEGHIWDIIDELVDNVVLLCKEPSISSSDVMDTESSNLNPFINEDTNIYPESEYSIDNYSVDLENMMTNVKEKITSNEINIQDKDSTSQENLNDMNTKTSSVSVENYIRNILSNHIEEIDKTANDDTFEDAIYLNLSNSEINKSIPNDEIPNITPNTEDNNEKIVEINNDTNINNDFNEYIDKIQNAFNNDILENEAIQEPNNMNNSRKNIDIIKRSFLSENIPKEVSISLSNSEIKEEITSLPNDNDIIEVIMNNKSDFTNNIEEDKNIEINESMPLKDITSDDSIKKVKFSNMDSEQGHLNTKSNSLNNQKFKDQTIHFAPPNDNLLSDADESWPENLSLPTVKATVSISKSVLSLGKINEIEEKKNDPSFLNEDDKSANNVDIDEEIVQKTINKDVIETNNKKSDKEVEKKIDEDKMLVNINLDNEHIIEEKPKNTDLSSVIKDVIDIDNVESDREVQKNNDINMTQGIDQNITNNDPRSVTKDDIETNNIELDSIEVQGVVDKNINPNKHVVDKYLTRIDNRSAADDILEKKMVREILTKVTSNVLLNNNRIYEGYNNLLNKSISKDPTHGDSGPSELKNKTIQITNLNNKSPVNLSVVHLPVIFVGPEQFTQKTQDHGKALQKVETPQTRYDENCPYKESELRIWCQGLQNVIKNLDMGLNWIDNTCSNLLQLKQENLSLHKRKIQKNNNKWIILKRNIDSDARLWEKLSSSLQVGLRCYNYYHKQLEFIYLKNECRVLVNFHYYEIRVLPYFR